MQPLLTVQPVSRWTVRGGSILIFWVQTEVWTIQGVLGAPPPPSNVVSFLAIVHLKLLATVRGNG